MGCRSCCLQRLLQEVIALGPETDRSLHWKCRAYDSALIMTFARDIESAAPTMRSYHSAA